MSNLRANPILDVDSYKSGHAALLPAGTTESLSYIEARKTGETIIPFGLQMWLKKTLMNPVIADDIDEAESIFTGHGDPFDRKPWETIIKEFGGYLPLSIYAIPEGTVTQSSTPMMIVRATDSRFAFLPSYIETSLQRGVWYPTTIASKDYANWVQLKYFYDRGSDNPGMLDFALHDFGARGVSSLETAEVGGLAHLIYFRGTDNIAAIRAGREYYKTDMAGFSVVATEHSIQCAYGRDNQAGYFSKVLDTYAKPGAIVSIVLDGYDVYRESTLLSTQFKEQIIASGAKVVFRPDSGDMFEVIPRILRIQEDNFGFTMNSKKKKVINNVGIIQGDGIDSTTLAMLAQRVDDLGYAPECVIYGSGGGLLQKVNRDTYSFAQKTSALKINGEWVSTVKDPITDKGKRSKGGLLSTEGMVEYYHNGTLLVDESLDVIRARATDLK